MVDQEKGKNRGTRIPRYFRKRNLLNDYCHCSKCGRGGKFYYIYYEEKTPNRIYCGNCFVKIKKKVDAELNKPKKEKRKAKNKAAFNKQKTQGEKKEKKTQTVPQIKEGYIETIPVGTTIYYGDPTYHKCQFDKRELVKRIYFIFRPGGTQTVTELYCCTGCGAYYAISQKSSLFQLYDVKHAATTQTQRYEQPLKERPVYREFGFADFLTRSTVHTCSAAGHDLVDIQVGIKIMKKDFSIDRIVVPAVYCKDCDRYFILESEYQDLDCKGRILCNVVEEDYWTSSINKDFSFLNPESLLYKMGYNVSSNNALSMKERHLILKAALNNGLLTRAEIVSHLDYLINRSKNRGASFDHAISKWKADREYIRKVSEKDDLPTFEARSITHRTRRKQ